MKSAAIQTAFEKALEQGFNKALDKLETQWPEIEKTIVGKLNRCQFFIPGILNMDDFRGEVSAWRVKRWLEDRLPDGAEVVIHGESDRIDIRFRDRQPQQETLDAKDIE